MSRTVLYRYNPDTDNFERVYPTLKERALKALGILAAGCAIGILIFITAYYGFGTPTETALRKENSQLKAQYNVLSHRLDNAVNVMASIQSRDDNFYRVMMQMEPLSRGERLAGLDNEQRYRSLNSLTDAELVSTLTRRMDMLDRQIYAQSLSFDQLRDTASRQQTKLAHIPSVLPMSAGNFTLASGYGYRRDAVNGATRFHQGLDFAAATGTPVMATADGTVKHARRESVHGNVIIIDHGYNYTTLYSHLQAMDVAEGDKVKRGQHIGFVGSTGKSTGPHLHYEVRFKGAPQNPVNYYFMDVTPEQYAALARQADNAGHTMD